LLVCEKNISVSHIANGATRLQPVVMGIGQAAGMAAALCCELECQPRDLPVRKLQTALLTNQQCPTSIVPLFNLPINHPEWLDWQIHYLEKPEAYPTIGNCPCLLVNQYEYSNLDCFIGIFNRLGQQEYGFIITNPTEFSHITWQIVTLRSHIDKQLQALPQNQKLTVWGHLNSSGNWLLVEYIDEVSN
jgi:hypothetical protein